MAYGLGILKLSPREFWAMTPRELQAAFSIRDGRHKGRPQAIGRAQFEHLMARYPDKDNTL